MPKAPILSRDVFYTRLRDGSFKYLDWNLVNTEQGACVEPRNLIPVVFGAITQLDPYDTSFTRETQINEDEIPALFGTGGQQVPLDYNTQ